MFNIMLRQNIYIYSIVVLFMALMYPIIVFDSINKANPVNFILYVFSLSIFLYAIFSIRANNLNTYNVFLFFYFFALFFNTLNLSFKQFEKTVLDVYFYLLPPLIVFLFLFLFENLKVYKLKFKGILKIDVTTVYILILFMYIAIKLYIGFVVGFRIYDYNDLSIIPSGDKYTIPGLSGVSALLQWLLIILIPYVKKRYVVVSVISIIILSGIMNVKRGDIIRIMIFILLYYIFIEIQLKKLDMNKVKNIFLGIIVGIVIFVLFGEYRLEARGGTESLIIEYLGSRIDSVTVSWLYSYFSFNFEILKKYYEFIPTYQPDHLLELFGANLNHEQIGLETTISGFNASTFISPFILDYGYFYFFEVYFFAFFIGVLIYIIKKIDFVGLYIFILMLMALMVFGDYLINRAMFVTIIVSIFIFPFIKFHKNNFLTLRKNENIN